MQHNILGEWLHNSLCLVYEAVGGLCNLAIGPLEEHQAFIPIEFDKLQGPTIIERLEQAQGILSITASDDVIAKSLYPKISANENDLEEVKVKMIALELKFDDLSSDMRGKLDTAETSFKLIEIKVDSMEDKVDKVRGELHELKEMMADIMEMMAKTN